MDRAIDVIAYLLAKDVAKKEKRTIDDVIQEALDYTKPVRITADKSIVIDDATVNRIYAIYPGKTDRGSRGICSTGKCAKDRDRIRTLLKTHTPEQLENAIREYIEDTGGMYLKNFSTFLNNIPEDGLEEPTLSFEDNLRAKGYK